VNVFSDLFLLQNFFFSPRFSFNQYSFGRDFIFVHEDGLTTFYCFLFSPDLFGLAAFFFAPPAPAVAGLVVTVARFTIFLIRFCRLPFFVK